MNRTNRRPDLHMLLLGMSHDHILVEVKSLGFRHAVIFTSANLAEDARSFSASLTESGVTVHEIICVDPFNDDSLEKTTETIRATIQRYSAEYNITCGLTGGTNIMAISMAMAAFYEGLPCHYSMERDWNPVIPITYLKEKHEEVFK